LLRMRTFPLLVLLLTTSCGTFTGADERSIRSVMSEQEAAWDRGDIPGFMEGYADTICFVSKRGRTCGKEAVTTNYLASYPNKAAMGDLTFTIHEVVPAGSQNAWVSGGWSLSRERDTLGGSFALFWQKQESGWLIVRDHTN